MRDPATFYTKQGVPLIMVVSRCFFAFYFAAFLVLRLRGHLDDTSANLPWLIYLLGIYAISEYIYASFLKKQIDLSFAFPLLLAIYILHGISLLIRGQEEVPLINRAEHFTSFILLTYIVWVFFRKYLPQDVWQQHPYYTALLVLSITSLAGVVNEVVELFLDVAFGTNNIGPGFDTPLDLLMNSLGSGLFLSVRLILSTAIPIGSPLRQAFNNK